MSCSSVTGVGDKDRGVVKDSIMYIQSQSHRNGDRRSELQIDGRSEISNRTSSNNADPVVSPGGTIDGAEILALVEWLNYIIPYLRLPKDASEEEIRGCLIDGTVLCRILNKLCPGSVEMGGSSDPGFANVKRFLVSVEELGFPTFELLDLEQGSMVPVLRCLSALKASFDFGRWGEDTIDETKSRELLETEYLRKIDRSQSFSRQRQHATQNGEEAQESLHDSTSEVTTFLDQLKQGSSVDIFDNKILESIKATSLDNASSRALFTVGNKILEDSAEKNNGDVPQHLAYLLRKVMQVIEQRFANQTVNLRIQNNTYKSREEKYQMKMKVRETLESGTSEEIQVVLDQLKQKKIEQFNIEEKKKVEEQDILRVKEERDQMGVEISTLKQELQSAKSTHESHCLQLEANVEKAKLELERKLKELELMLNGSRKNEKELEASLESVSRKWKQKEGSYQNFVNYQARALKELTVAMESTKREIMTAKRNYYGEFKCMGTKLKGLADAAEKYHVVMAENRKLYNEVQDLKGNIRVYCRIRPFLPGQSQKQQSTIEYVGENGDLVIANPSKPKKDSQKLFKFNKVFGPAATQEEVFVDTRPLIRSVLDGYNVCIFAYGQTGSGKTYTMSGPSISSTESWGVNYRALNDLFQISQSRKNSIEYEVGVQMVEIYNEQVLDLLSSDGSRKRLGIWNSTQPNGLAVPDASMHLVNSTADVLKLMNIGLANRSVGTTALNERSSRSHSVLTVHVRGLDLKTDTTIRGNLHLVDLAGSERVDRSEVTGDRLREAQHINKSLSALGDVIFALAQKNTHVPFRNSKLTQVLQSSLGGQAKTLMFVQLNPDAQSYSETISTLKFAERVSGVELGAAKSNKEGKYVRELMEQVASLKETVAKKDEEIDRLKSNNNGIYRGMSVLRSASCSPRRYSTGSPRHSVGSPRQRKLSSLVDKVGAYRDSFSEAADDRYSEVGSQLSMDDFRHQKHDVQMSKLRDDTNQNPNEDFELLGFGDEDAGERLSDISDGVLSMGAETDGSLSSSAVEFTLFPEATKPTEITTTETSVPKTTQAQSALREKTPSNPSVRFAPTSKLPKPTPRVLEAKATRSSLVKSSSKFFSSAKKPTAGSSTTSLKSGKR